MLTLTFGFKKPQSTDKGPTVFPAMEQNIQQINDHDHDGANSKKLTTASIIAVLQTLVAANWVDLGGGNYHQQVTMIPGYDYDTVSLSFRDAAGSYVFPSVTKISSSIFDVTTNDPTSDLTVLYGV